ncbi:MAG: hypothetical protein K940chlam9_00083 [Chlamydiae bacterium]|nr:hypothetical protein [Chlamydiota bacterium]
MKKHLLVIFLVFGTFFAPLSAYEILVEGKIGAYFPKGDTIKDVFSNTIGNYQAEISWTPFRRSVCLEDWWKNLYAFGSVSYITSRGETITEDDTDFEIIPVSLGIKYIQPLPWCFEVYGSIAPRYFFLDIHNENEGVKSTDRARGLGGVYSIGALFRPCRCLFVDLYVDYSHKRFDDDNFESGNNIIAHTVELSGFTAGIGLGLAF